MNLKRTAKCFTVSIVLFALSGFVQKADTSASWLRFPFKKAGLTERQAAAHLLNRFTFGPVPGEVDEVLAIGLEKWFNQQLNATMDDSALNRRLLGYDALTMHAEDIVNTYLSNGQVLALAKKEGLTLNNTDISAAGKKQYNAQLQQYMQEKGLKPQIELERQLINQKILRAAYSNNQLQEVMTDFWFNHFNVSLTKGACQPLVLPFERDAIRPNALGFFDHLLQATAHHPAMLEYLDNASSVSNNNPKGQRQNNLKNIRQELHNGNMDSSANNNAVFKNKNNKGNQGLNENYAREIMELHTLGVDGGYTQTDVTELARVLTGWTVYPMIKDSPGRALIEKAGGEEKLKEKGFITDHAFLYRPDKHDEGEKTFLGHPLPSNGGYQEGVQMLELLAHHPSTAHFIATKLAVHFVGDHPSETLIKSMADAFTLSGGDIKKVLLAMVNSKEFWMNDAGNVKIKSPFELAISAVRATKTDISQPFQLFMWCGKMGQKFYYYPVPTGFPDAGSFWINTGSVLNRMNFGLAFATHKIPGINPELAALTNYQEPESMSDAVQVYSNLLLPERDNSNNIKRLIPLLTQKDLQQRLTGNVHNSMEDPLMPMQEATSWQDNQVRTKAIRQMENKALKPNNSQDVVVTLQQGTNNIIAQVTGLILGSPEFQKK